MSRGYLSTMSESEQHSLVHDDETGDSWAHEDRIPGRRDVERSDRELGYDPGRPGARSRVSSVKVDADTLRVIGDLAHVLGRTRKDVVRDAVHAFAAWRERSLEAGVDATVARLVTAGAHHRATATDPGIIGAQLGASSRLGVARMSEAVFDRCTSCWASTSTRAFRFVRSS